MQLDLVFLTILFFAILCLGTMVALAKRKILLFVFIPLTLIITASVIHTYNDLLGKPTTKEMPKEFFVVSHIIASDEDLIYLWIVHEGENFPMSYELSHSEEKQKRLEGLQKKRQQIGHGVIIRGHRPNENEDVEFELYYFMDDPRLKKESGESNP